MFNVFNLSSNLGVTDTGGTLDPTPEVKERIDAVWREEKKRRGGALYNGRVFNVSAITPESITGFYVDYAAVVAQQCDPNLLAELELRPLAVCGFVSLKQGIVFGLRNDNLTTDAGLWELAVSGGVDDSVRNEDGTIDYQEQFLNELGEELNVPPDTVTAISPMMLIEDTKTHVYDIVLDVRLSIGPETLFPLFNECGREEYISIDVIPEQFIKGFVQLMKGAVTPATLHILDYKGYIKLMALPE